MAKGRTVRVLLASIGVMLVAACTPMGPPPPADDIVTLRPNGDLAPNGWVPFGASTVSQAVGDDNDTTYMAQPAAAPGEPVLDLTTAQVSSIEAVRIRVRARYTVENTAMQIGIQGGGVFGGTLREDITLTGTVTEYVGQWHSAPPSGGAWTQAQLDVLRSFVKHLETGEHDQQITEIFVDVRTD